MSVAVPRVPTRLLTGVPGSGTSLCCRLAGRLPGVVVLNEPMDAHALDRVRTPEAATAVVRAFVHGTRAGLRADGRAPSVRVDGGLNDEWAAAAPSAGGLRTPPRGVDETRLARPLPADFLLVVKHDTLFAALLKGLSGSFPVLAVVRNPVAMLASWDTVDLPVRRGRVPMGERFDRDLARVLDAQPDVLRRRIHLLSWFFARYRSHVPAPRVLRYEDIVAQGGRPLFAALGFPDAPAEPLEGQDANPLYAGADAGAMPAAVRVAHCWAPWYSPADLRAAADAIREAR